MKETEYITEERNVEAEKHASIAQKIGLVFGLAACVAGGAPTPEQVKYFDATNNEVTTIETVGRNEANLKEITDGNVRYQFDEAHQKINVDMTDNHQGNTFCFLIDPSRKNEWENIEVTMDTKEAPSNYELIYDGVIEPIKEISSDLAEKEKNNDEANSLMENMLLAELDAQEGIGGPPPNDGDISIDDEGKITVNLASGTDAEEITEILLNDDNGGDGDDEGSDDTSDE